MSNLPTDHTSSKPKHPSASERTTPANRFGLLSDFFANNAWLSLFTLLIFGGVALGLGRAWTFKPVLSSASSSSVKEPGARGIDAPSTGAVSCAQLAVHFQSNASLRELGRLLRGLDAAIVFGPDENGAYRLRVAPKVVGASMKALESSPLVTSAEILAGCL